MGIVLKEQGKLEEAIAAYNKALAFKPDYAEAYSNMGIVLQDQGKLEEAIAAYNKALAFKPDYAEAYSNMGNVLKDQGKLEEAIEAYNKALAIKPDYAEAYSNMGIAFQEQGKLEEAIEAFNKALAIKPDYAGAYLNMGVALADQGKQEEAIDAYNKALAIKPDHAGAHRNLSIVTKYNSDTAQISEVEALLQRTDLDDSNRCHLLYTHAKMQEDLGDLSAAFDSYVTGGDLRQKLLAYAFKQDKHLFGQIKKIAPQFKDVALNLTGEQIGHTPIFILGMPRSGTTLVEQIISSHSEVTGAGELKYTQQFGVDLTVGQKPVNSETVQSFRKRYLAELAKRADGQAFITDKMPQNFRYIALIRAALPEAKIVHVQRSAEATCWSNFKHYFASKGLGYSYSLRETVAYHGLYKDLMHFWYQSYSDHIYNLDYDKLTEDQEPETRRLIKYLELNWEDACLAPQNNKRSVKTASQQQVRQKVYKGSSQAWRKYEPFLDGVFDGLKA
jgi:tetratricopeptide (TPR) repeat protein